MIREKQTLVCGTIRANRGIPTQLVEQAVDRTGDSCALLDDKIVATKYHSTKVVYILSTIDMMNYTL
ncbi:hypothetical protein KUTeg_021976 [Tegillarca granosa]|uniref:Uncharacterized protein n=1 Tax=Tegillarca granosa TaxID=220873 RepID=A0ABQ9E5A0_TEGGR|nr:hypothetical protein KUTeg_021976 [Tegillarca granosa]